MTKFEQELIELTEGKTCQEMCDEINESIHNIGLNLEHTEDNKEELNKMLEKLNSL